MNGFKTLSLHLFQNKFVVDVTTTVVVYASHYRCLKEAIPSSVHHIDENVCVAILMFHLVV